MDDVSVAVDEYLELHADLGVRNYAVLTRGKQRFGFREYHVQAWGLDGSLWHEDVLWFERRRDGPCHLHWRAESVAVRD